MKYIFASATLLAGLAAADIAFPFVTTPTASWFTDSARVSSAVSKFDSEASASLAILTTQPAYSAFASALASVQEGADSTDAPADLFGTPEVPSYWSELPTSAQAYVTSVAGQEQSLLNAVVSGGASAATPAPVVKAAAVAGAGALAGAVMLL